MPHRRALIYYKTFSSTESNSIKQNGTSAYSNVTHFVMQTKSALSSDCFVFKIFFLLDPTNSLIFFGRNIFAFGLL